MVVNMSHIIVSFAVLLSLVLYCSAQSLEILFGEVDRRVNEDSNVAMISLLKRGGNANNISVLIRALTLQEYANQFGPLPADFTDEATIPDPAEFNADRRDFVKPENLRYVFPASMENDEVTVMIPLVDDEINELDEGFLLLAEIEDTGSEMVDNNVTLIRGGLALIIIGDDDFIAFSFERPEYTVTEGNRTVSDLVRITKNNMTSEQTLSIIVQTSPVTASVGDDYFAESVTTLVFPPDVNELPFSFDLFDDDIAETTESFQAFLSIPQLNQRGLQLTDPRSTTVNIVDNEVAVVEFEQTSYTVLEDGGSVEVCVSITPDELSDDFIVTGILSTNDGTAEDGQDYDEEQHFFLLDFVALRDCFNITIRDNEMQEPDRMFTVMLVPDNLPDNQPNVAFPQTNVTVTIQDEDSAIECQLLASPANGMVSFTTIPGSNATYSCDTGYTLNGGSTRTCQSDGTWSGSAPTCEDIDECSDPSLNSCHPSANCRNTMGNFTCECVLGFEGDGFTCTAIDCGPLDPPTNGVVTVTTTTFESNATYSCNTGYTLNGGNTRTCQLGGTWSGSAPTCQDIDECSNSSLNNCHPSAICLNTLGSFTCECVLGFEGDGVTCTAIDCGPLNAPANGGVTFTTTFGSNAVYTCNNGYALNGGNTRTCQIDGTWSGSAPTCQDINECMDPTLNNCHPSANCLNTMGSFTCECVLGFEGDGITCTIIDCRPLTSPANGMVFFTTTTFDSNAVYSCNTGYSINGPSSRTCQSDGTWSGSAPTCLDINECSDSALNDCDPRAVCDNTQGSFTCTCPAGFTGNGRTCTPIEVDNNECDTDGDCHRKAVCVAIPGGNRCVCRPGFSGDGMSSCSDINECASPDTNQCGANSRCLNTYGTYFCRCNRGFRRGRNKYECRDYNECVWPWRCGNNGLCINTEGGFSCSCVNGFQRMWNRCITVADPLLEENSGSSTRSTTKSSSSSQRSSSTHTSRSQSTVPSIADDVNEESSMSESTSRSSSSSSTTTSSSSTTTRSST